MRRQRSTGDIQTGRASGSIRSTGSSASWMSTDSGQSAYTVGDVPDEGSNASFIIEVGLVRVACSSSGCCWCVDVLLLWREPDTASAPVTRTTPPSPSLSLASLLCMLLTIRLQDVACLNTFTMQQQSHVDDTWEQLDYILCRLVQNCLFLFGVPENNIQVELKGSCSREHERLEGYVCSFINSFYIMSQELCNLPLSIYPSICYTYLVGNNFPKTTGWMPIILLSSSSAVDKCASDPWFWSCR